MDRVMVAILNHIKAGIIAGILAGAFFWIAFFVTNHILV